MAMEWLWSHSWATRDERCVQWTLMPFTLSGSVTASLGRSAAPRPGLQHTDSGCIHSCWNPANADAGQTGLREGGDPTATLAVTHQGCPWMV